MTDDHRSSTPDVDDDYRRLERLEGLHVGLLEADEIACLDRLVAAGKAKYWYEGAAGLMGLAKVKLL